MNWHTGGSRHPADQAILYINFAAAYLCVAVSVSAFAAFCCICNAADTVAWSPQLTGGTTVLSFLPTSYMCLRLNTHAHSVYCRDRRQVRHPQGDRCLL